jgi:hypothetical protein
MDDTQLAKQIENEEALLAQINEAKDANDFEKVQALMQDLIAVQREFIPVEATDEELAAAGVDMAILQKERQLAEEIRIANQAGDFIKAKELTRDLRVLQKLQPEHRAGVRYG